MTVHTLMHDQLVRAHRWLVPQHEKLGWMPYVWLIYLGFLFFQFFFAGTDTLVWTLTVLSIVIFLPIYFVAFNREGPALKPYIGALTALGVLLLPWNGGGSVYFVYAASFCGWVGPPGVAVRHITLVVLIAVLETLLLDLHPSSMVVVVIVGLMVGAGNIVYRQMESKNEALRQSQDEIRRLATSSERERIARDLHDLLGHTLSTITLKSELAGKLIAGQPLRARREMAEVERVSRDALHQVRAGVAGYRAGNIRTELASGKLALETSGIALDYQLQDLDLAQALENMLALVLREGLTNVLRHSGAEHCRVVLEADEEWVVLTISDDGCGEQCQEGSGLSGMRERLATYAGRLSVTVNDCGGLRLRAEVPRSYAQQDQPSGQVQQG